MTRRRGRHTLLSPATLALLAAAFIAILLSVSVLSAAAPGTAPEPGRVAASVITAPGAAGEPSLEPLGHPETAGSYTAQGLMQARWATGSVQAGWTHRAVWQVPVTGEGVRVAVIDTGVDAGHPDLAGKVVAWRDFVDARDTPYDDTGHGTHVAGIIAAGGHPQLRPDQAYFITGARGIAPDSQIIAAKAMDAAGRGDPARIAEAILWALDEGAHVINLSLGISLPSDGDAVGARLAESNRLPFAASSSMHRVEEAIMQATEAGAVVVVAAGNHDAGQDGAIMFPGTMREVITVGATDPSGRVASFSNTGSPGSGKPDLVAPGVVVSTSPRDPGSMEVARYRGLGGTSMAAPFVSATIALIMEADASLMEQSRYGGKSENTQIVRSILTATARPVAGATAQEQGAGLLRVDAALDQAGTGEAGVRPEAYATPFLLAVGGYWVVRRRRAPRGRRLPTATTGSGPGPVPASPAHPATGHPGVSASRPVFVGPTYPLGRAGFQGPKIGAGTGMGPGPSRQIPLRPLNVYPGPITARSGPMTSRGGGHGRMDERGEAKRAWAFERNKAGESRHRANAPRQIGSPAPGRARGPEQPDWHRLAWE